MSDPIGREVDRVSVRVIPGVRRFLPDLQKYLKRIESQVRVEIPTNLDTTGLMQEAQRAAAAIEQAVDVDIPVNADTAAAETQLAAVARPRTATVNVDVDRASLSNALSAIANFTSGIAGTLTKTGLIGLGVGGVALTGAALVGVMAQATGVLAVLPALALGATTAVGILGAAFIGLSDATDDLSKGIARELSAIGSAIQDTSRQALFPGLTDALQTFRNDFLPTYLAGIEQIGARLGTLSAAFADAITTPRILRDTAAGMQDMALGLDNLTPAIRPFVRAITDLSVVGGSLLPGLASQLAEATERFAAFIGEARQSGALEDFITGSLAAVGELVSLLGNVGGALAAIARAAQSASGGVLGGLDVVFERLHGFLDSARGQTALEGLFAGIAAGFEAIGDAMGPVGDALTNVLPALGDVLQTVGEVFGAVLENAAPLIGAVAQPIADLVGVLGTILTDVLDAVGPALLPAFQALGGAWSELAESLAPLGPVLAESLGELATAFADMVVQLAPHLPEIVRAVVDTLLPLIPALTDALITILPPLTELLVVLAENLPGIVENLAPLLGGIAALLGPLSQFVALGLGLAGALTAALLPLETMRVAFTNKALGESIGMLSEMLGALAAVLRGDVAGAAETVAGAFGRLFGAINENVASIIALIAGIPERILSAMGDLGGLLYQSGVDLVGGLVDGMASMLPAVGSISGLLASEIAEHWPGSPVKKGPLTSWNNGGAGKRLMDMLVDGMDSRGVALRNASNRAAGLLGDDFLGTGPGGGAVGGMQALTITNWETGQGFLARIADGAVESGRDLDATRGRMNW